MDNFLSGSEKYPKELLEGRVSVEGNVIASIYKDILLLDETELTSKDFITEDGVFYFGLAKLIRDRGFNVIDEVTILSNTTELVIDGFVDRGGWDTIQHFTDVINERNWEKYIDTLYRENIILNLHSNGFNLLNPIIEIDNKGKEKSIVPLLLFRKMSAEEVLDWYESKISGFGTGYSSKILEEEDIEITDDFLSKLCSGEESGVPFDIFYNSEDDSESYCLPQISKHINGMQDGTSNCIAGHSSTGKSTLSVSMLMGLIYRGRKVLYISNEEKSKAFKIRFILWILAKRFKYFNITKKKLTNGDLTEIDKEYLKKAQLFWNETIKGNFKFISIPDSDIALVKKKCRENILKYGFDVVYYDTMKLDMNGNDDNHWLSLIKDARALDVIAKKYNIIMIFSLQLALNSLGRLFLDSNCLSMSKQIKETLTTLILMRTVYSEELDKENKKFYISPFRRKLTAGKWINEEYEVDKDGVYRCVFIDKSRESENSSDTGIAHLLKFNGAAGTFSEVAMCKPKHGIIQ